MGTSPAFGSPQWIGPITSVAELQAAALPGDVTMDDVGIMRQLRLGDGWMGAGWTAAGNGPLSTEELLEGGKRPAWLLDTGRPRARRVAEELAERVPTVNYVRWGGGVATVEAPIQLGRAAAQRRPLPQHGPRRALMDAAYGHVSGFPLSAIVYYVLTRSLFPAVMERTLDREGRARAAAASREPS